MRTKALLGLVFLLAALIAGCSSPPQAPAEPAPAAPVPEAETTPPPPTQADESADAPPPAPVAPAPVANTPQPTPQPVDPPEPAEATPPPAPAPAPTTSTVVDPGGQIEVDATRPGLTRIGSNKCKICHKVQYASWAESGHALRTPPLECEGCHGPGSAYKSKKVMEDPQATRAAGMVIPEMSFCAQCHTAEAADEFVTTAHAHKVDEP